MRRSKYWEGGSCGVLEESRVVGGGLELRPEESLFVESPSLNS